MSFEPFHLDHEQLDVFLVAVLDAYKDGRISRSRATELLGHLVTAAAMDDEATLQAAIWFEKDIY